MNFLLSAKPEIKQIAGKVKIIDGCLLCEFPVGIYERVYISFLNGIEEINQFFISFIA